MSTINNLDFRVRRDDHSICESVPAPAAEPEPGQIAVKIDAFALTANNITYATLGDTLKYWSFFPADEGWGRIPVWGFADVTASNHDDVQVGQRFYGYWPMSSSLVLQPERVGPNGFTDGIPHRKGLPGLYNSYALTSADPFYDANFEEMHMVLYPLFGTSFLIADLLREGNPPAAKRLVFSSASSKTAFSSAYMLRESGLKIVGLTSAGNRDFVQGLGVYDQVVLYDEIDSMDASEPVAYVDYAGNASVTRAIHGRYQDKLVYSLGVGSSHPGKMEPLDDLPGVERTMFFAPTYSRKRMKALGGPRGMAEAMVAGWKSYRETASQWINSSRGSGPEAVQKVYLDMLQGRAKPDQGYVLSL